MDVAPARRQAEAFLNLRHKLSGESKRSQMILESINGSFREDAVTLPSNTSITSASSSPGSSLREKVDPSSYTFSTAVKALQGRPGIRGWDWATSSPQGPTLNSKWHDAERYISNPLSGEVPVECLSVKVLNARSFRSISTKITMSKPLVYSIHATSLKQRPVLEGIPIAQDADNKGTAGKDRSQVTSRSQGTCAGIQSRDPGSSSPEKWVTRPEDEVIHMKHAANKNTGKENEKEESRGDSKKGNKKSGELMWRCVSSRCQWPMRKSHDRSKLRRNILLIIRNFSCKSRDNNIIKTIIKI